MGQVKNLIDFWEDRIGQGAAGTGPARPRSLRQLLESDKKGQMVAQPGARLGVIQAYGEEFEGTHLPKDKAREKHSQRMYYDPTSNVWAVKFLISYWGTGAWPRDDKTIKFTKDLVEYVVWCHVDVATPKEKGLAHGKIEGPHLVVSAYTKGAGRLQNLKTKPAAPLTPDEVYKLALHQYEKCYTQGDKTATNPTWPDFIIDKLYAICSTR